MDRLILEDMIWPEVAEVLPEIKVALIPVAPPYRQPHRQG